MPRRQIIVENRTIMYAPEDAPPLGGRMMALVKARVRDELTGEPPASAVSVNPVGAKLFARVATDGLAGLVGIPQRAFPGLKTTNYDVVLSVRAAGYVPRDEAVQIPAKVNFPQTFQPFDAGDVFLHREPIIIKGRTLRVTGNTVASLASVAISISGIWRQSPRSTAVVPASPANVISIQPPLYHDRLQATASLRRRVFATPGSDLRLMDDARAGDINLRLANPVPLVAGELLLINALDQDRQECLSIDTVTPGSSPAQPVKIKLHFPLAFPHRRETIVRKVALSASGVAHQLDQSVNLLDPPARRGDGCLILDGLADLDQPPPQTYLVEISAGGATEYHTFNNFNTRSDADGFYRLPPLSRVTQAEVVADDGLGDIVTHIFSPNYDAPENQLDFVFN